ncbi:2-oxo-tetronate isomerase [Ochrobactrum soli]|uniref:Hydroxypyruvate isomerase family protein n=1 Tax=Ochrobactrum soli TaxID=2448455 RepID=A0A849KV84_9HYPH|nr:2-oxo-tetronate isomerase [[Ochrobactrum] soli]NNU62809.1 hydroxypyruvate isomerase family protein [[Ochrobactrum] soli]
MPKFAANLSMMFNERPFLERFQAAADAGFSAVEYLFPYDYPPETVAEALHSTGLQQALFNMPAGDWAAGDRGLASLPDRREEFNFALTTAITYGTALGTPLLHMMAGIASWDSPVAVSCYRDNLKKAADATAELGIGLVIEPINKRDMPGYFLNDFNRAFDLILDLDRPNLKLQFDIYHRQILHGDVLTALKQMAPRIGHIQVAAVPTRHEPMTGELDDRRIFQEIDAIGYQGYIGCEYRPAAKTKDGLGWMSSL